MHFDDLIVPKGIYTITVTDATSGAIKRQFSFPNLVVDAGLALIAAQHAGTSNSIEITTLELGDDATTPAAGDTALANAVKTGVAPSKQSSSGTSATISFFINDADLPNGTYREIGLKATSTLFTRALISPVYTKASGENTRIDYTITYGTP